MPQLGIPLFLGNLCVFLFLFFVVHVSKKNNKKIDTGVGVCGLAKPCFSWIFGTVLT